jgi:hypothetical protein
VPGYGFAVTREEAEREAAKLSEQHPERETHAWFARQDATGEWSVVKVRMPGSQIHGKATVEAKPKPPQADDPRPAMWRDVGGPYAGS